MRIRHLAIYSVFEATVYSRQRPLWVIGLRKGSEFMAAWSFSIPLIKA
jgi:hypothetical protein